MKIKKMLFYGVLILVVLGTLLSLNTCQLVEMVLGPDPNNILTWWPDFKVGTRLIYTWSVSYSDNSTATDTLTIKIIDVDKRSDKIVVKFNGKWKSDSSSFTEYYIVDKGKGIFAESDDEFFDKDDDFVHLETPIKEGTIWYYKDDYKYTIKRVKSTKSFAVGTYNNVIAVSVTNSDWHYISSLYRYYSPSGGFLAYEVKYDLNDYNSYGITDKKMELKEIDEP